MTKISKGRALLGSLIAVLALLALAVVPAMAQLPVFSPFSGDVTIDGADAPVGSQLRAYVDGELAELLAPAVDNVYTVTTAGEYEIVIEADATGDPVTFEVKKSGTTVWLPATTDPASPVTTYETQTVDVSAGTAAAYTLTITVSPSGKGTTSPSVGTHSYAAGTPVTVTAYPSSGWDFDYWSGHASGTSTRTTVTMNRDRSVTAHFEREGAPPATFKSWLYETFVECLVD